MNNQKIRVAVLSCVLLLGIAYTIYQYMGLNDEYEITDSEALSAAKWLKNADDGNFEECKKNAAVNMDKWFALFKNNRESLGKTVYRRLKSKAVDKKGVYKIVFNSSFKNTPKIHETIWTDKDAKVWQVKYSYSRRPFPSWRSKDTGLPRELTEVKREISQALRAMKDLDVDFFDQIMLRSEKFRFGKRLVKQLKQQREKYGLPYRTAISNRVRFTRSFPGQTEINGAIGSATCLYKVKGKVYRQNITVVLYKDNSVPRSQWNVHRFAARRIVKQKPRKPKKKKVKQQVAKNDKK
jgi:hypothetical protein